MLVGLIGENLGCMSANPIVYMLLIGGILSKAANACVENAVVRRVA